MALPWLDSFAAVAATPPSSAFPKRFAVMFMGNGVNEQHWGAEGNGDDMKLKLSLSPLEPLKKKIGGAGFPTPPKNACPGEDSNLHGVTTTRP